MIIGTRAKIVGGGVLLSLAAFWILWLVDSNPKSTSEASRPNPVSHSNAADRLLALEARREHWDNTIWTNEIQAQRHEDVFINLWDQLRNQEGIWIGASNFSFGKLRLGEFTAPTSYELGITRRQSSSPFRFVTLSTWHSMLAVWQREGYQLEQSEWRHRRFTRSTHGVGESIIAMTLHVSNPTSKERHIVRGDLRVEWRFQGGPDEEPHPELIDASGLELLSRLGETPFHHVLATDLMTDGIGARLTEPSLQVFDLDGNGLSEIILANSNRVFWNQGQGEFTPDRLFAYPLADLKAGLLADFDNDGRADFLAADSQGLALFAGDPQGRFLKPPRRIRFASALLQNPQVMTAGDIDRDGDLDVWLAQYKVPYQGGQMPSPFFDANDGFPSLLLQNDGQGNFQDRTEPAGLAAKRFRRTYSSSFADLDEDGDLDLLVVSDFAGVDLHLNDGHGRFSDGTARVMDEPRGFGMAHTFGDFDLDGHTDVFVIGMNSFAANRLDAVDANPPGFPEFTGMRSKMSYGNRLYFWRAGLLRPAPMSEQVAQTGWSWGVTSGDFDNDGDLDLYVVNGHISGRTARDYEPQFWMHDIYTGSSKEDAVVDRYHQAARTRSQAVGLSYGGYEKNRFFLNLGGQSFLEAGYLLGVSMEQDCRNAVSDDLDGDGKLDLLVTTFQMWPKPRQELHLFPNFTEKPGNWIGLRLREAGVGFSPIGAKVTLSLTGGQKIRQFVAGDSYRSQHSATAHFGIGRATAVASVEVVWSNGRRKTLQNPAINTYHSIQPDGL